ncbi:MAG: FlgD immunoglobulin-like domain containing protein, partial [Candidatus Delongbacteria bacterium]
NDYLSQTIQNVEVMAGGTTENIDFTLYYYLPDSYLEFSADTLFFLTEFQFQQDFVINNISMTDINVTAIDRGSAPVHYEPYDLTFPQYIAPDDSLELMIALMIPTKPSSKEIQNDSIFIHTDMGSYVILVVYDDIYLNAIEDDNIQVSDFLLNNYPNPFNPSTKISFMLKSDSNIELSVYNLKGELVRTIANGLYKSGHHELNWDGKDSDQKSVTSGVYILKLSVDDKVGAVKNCIFLK